ncbi:MAG TPA: MurR/RpiR family transcriptional regulator [Kineosporiaceae bacterium]|nr:MurR/RpiR family transcriptional regulator [Kineosporiaceae bacterium]
MGVLNRPETVPERIRAWLPDLPPAERRVARLVLAHHPLAGLDTASALAAQAGTSTPTVLRLLARLGFDGWADFQRASRAELADRLAGPADLYPPDDTREAGGPGAVASAVACSLALVPRAEVDTAVRLLADQRRPVWTVGGRWSGVLADYLAMHLQLLRPLVRRVGQVPGGTAGALLDVDRRAVVVAFDYRRYQFDVIAFGGQAVDRGAELVLFTDHLVSPLAGRARAVLSTTVDAGSPFTVLSPGMALVDTLVARLVDVLGAAPRARMARYDELALGLVQGVDSG